MATRRGRGLIRGTLAGALLATAGCLVPISPGPAPRLDLPVDSFAAAVYRDTDDGGTAELAGGLSGAPLPDSPLDLEALQELARHRNPSVAEWEERVAAAESRLREARAAFYPAILMEGRYIRQEEAIESEIPVPTATGVRVQTVTFREKETNELQSRLRYTLHDWGRNQLVHGARAHDLQAETASRTRALEELDGAVARTYYGILQARQDGEILAASVRTLTGALRNAEDLREAGRATEADVLVVRARLERRRFARREAADVVQDLEEEMVRLLDLPHSTRLELVDPGSFPAAVPELEVLERLALRRRKELESLNERHASLRQASLATGASYLPEVFFFLQNDLTDSETVLTESSLFSGGFGFSWEIFDGGRRHHGMQALAAEAEQVRARHREVAGQVLLEVRQAVRAYRRSEDAITVAETVVAQAEENLRQVGDLFRQGRATGQEVLEAETLLTAERARRARAIYDRHLAHARLRLAVGVGSGEELPRSAP